MSVPLESFIFIFSSSERITKCAFSYVADVSVSHTLGLLQLSSSRCWFYISLFKSIILLFVVFLVKLSSVITSAPLCTHITQSKYNQFMCLCTFKVWLIYVYNCLSFFIICWTHKWSLRLNDWTTSQWYPGYMWHVYILLKHLRKWHWLTLSAHLKWKSLDNLTSN